MPQGKPDWGVDWTPRTVWGLEDLSEHAARLESPNVWDRRGDVIFQTDFRNGAGDVRFFRGGANAASGLWTGASRKGAFCCYLTSGSTLPGYTALIKTIPFPVMGYCGVEASWSFVADTAYIVLMWDVRMAADNPQPTLQLDPNTGVLRIQTGVAAWHTISTTENPYRSPYCLNTMKMVFDLANRVYVRVILNENSYPLPNIPIYIFAAGGAPFAGAEFRHYGDGGKNAKCYVDSFIVTQNEPQEG